MQSKKKFNTLLPTLKKRCCFLKFIDFEPIVKYGSIFIILVSIFIQSSNIIQNKNLLRRFKKFLKKLEKAGYITIDNNKIHIIKKVDLISKNNIQKSNLWDYILQSLKTYSLM